MLRILKEFLILEVEKIKQYKSNSIAEILTSVTYIVINLLFWEILFEMGYKLPGWTKSHIYVFIAFSELFFGLHRAFVAPLSRFWLYIISGQLDTILVRPLDPRVRLFMLNVNYMEIIKSIIVFTFLIVISGSEANIVAILLGVAMCFVGLLNFALIQLTLSYSSFWLGQIDSINELSDALSVLNKYPTTIFNNLFFNITRFIIPIYFFSTFSTQIVNGVSNNFFALGILGMFSSTAIWTLIHNFVWKKGIEKYESFFG